jgi:DnaJ-class molecular chaperone
MSTQTEQKQDCLTCKGAGYIQDHTKEIKSETNICNNCHGSGLEEPLLETCTECHGEGDNCFECDGTGIIKQESEECYKCDGTGWIKQYYYVYDPFFATCGKCNGKGYLNN